MRNSHFDKSENLIFIHFYIGDISIGGMRRDFESICHRGVLVTP
ncbi:MAG: hypothetical protein AAFU53_12145 [Cyanobacteria bacterium J06632_3]